MNHTSHNRPELPGSTNAPGPAGRNSVYSTRIPPTFPPKSASGNRAVSGEQTFPSISQSPTTRNQEGMLMMHSNTMGRLDGPPPGMAAANARNTAKAGSLRLIQEKTISRLTAKLPTQLRGTVTSVVEMAFASTDDVQQQLDMCRFEVCALREQLSKRNHEVVVLTKNCDIQKEKLVQLEDSIEVLKDNIETNQKHNIKNKAAMNRLASTNRMLFDSLEALQHSEGNRKVGNATDAFGGQQRPVGATAGGNQLTSQSGKSMSPSKRFNPENEESLFQSDKLRESLLRVTREHYKFMKYAENLDRKVTELRGSLRSQEQLNRKLKSEVDEYRALLRTGDDADDRALVGGEVGSNRSKKNHHSAIDARLQDMIERNGFDPIDGIQLLRRILAHMATAPNNLCLRDMIRHIVAQDALRIFSCDMICLFIKPTSAAATGGTATATTVAGDGESVLLRYTVKSPHPVEVNCSSSGSSSLAAEVIRSGKAARINVLDGSAFHADVDCVSGVLAKRVMSLPLYNTQSREVYGCLHMINKRHNELYADVDELFGLIFADQSSLLLTSCMMFDNVSYHADLLQSLLESATALFAVIPDANSLAVSKSLSPGIVLTALESIAKDLLKCSDARAFFVSDYVGMGSGRLVLLDKAGNHSSVSREVQCNSLLTPPLHSAGIAGHVVQSRAVHQMSSGGYDTYVNPTVDVDPLNSAMVALPIMDLYGTVVGCIELVLGPRSPGVRQASITVGDSLSISSAEGLSFIQAAQWFIHQITTPLQYLINFIGRPVARPISTPSRITRTPGKHSNSRSFFGYALDGVDEHVNSAAITSIGAGASGAVINSSQLPLMAAYSNVLAAGGGGHAQLQLPPVAAVNPIEVAPDSEDFLSLPLAAIKPAPIESTADLKSAAAAALQEESPSKLQQQNDLQQQQLEDLQKKFDDGTNEIAALQGEVNAYKSLLDSVREELEEAKAQTATAVTSTDDSLQQQQLATAAAEIAQLQLQLEQQQQQLVAKASTDDALQALDRALAQQAAADKEVNELRVELAAVSDARSSLQQQLTASEIEVKKLANELEVERTAAAMTATTAAEVQQAAVAESNKLREEVTALLLQCSQQSDELMQQQQSLQQLTATHEAAIAEKSQLIEQLQQQQQQQQSAGTSVEESQHEQQKEQIIALAASNEQLQQQVQSLNDALIKKEAIQSALQQQIVKMAGLSSAGAATSDAEALLFGSAPTAATATTAAGGAVKPPPQQLQAMSLAEELLFSASSKNLASTPTATATAAASAAEELLFGSPKAATLAASSAEDLLFGTKRPPHSTTDNSGSSSIGDDSWLEQTDSNGNVYYYNQHTGESSWTNPNIPDSGIDEIAASILDGVNAVEEGGGEGEAQYNSDGLLQRGDWVQNFDDSGTPYWINQVSGESAWTLP